MEENKKFLNVQHSIPLKKEIVAGVTVLTLGSGGSSFFMENPLPKVGLLSIMATFKCLVNGKLAAKLDIRRLVSILRPTKGLHDMRTEVIKQISPRFNNRYGSAIEGTKIKYNGEYPKAYKRKTVLSHLQVKYVKK